MKRCSKCDFTFEDYHQFCDFDATELTIIPEQVRSSNRVSIPTPLLIRIARSRVSVALLALAGVMLSALLIGYYDSGGPSNIEMAATSESQNGMENQAFEDAKPSEKTTAERVVKPRMVSTQRIISADEKPSSMPSGKVTSKPDASRSFPLRPRTTSKRETPASGPASRNSTAKTPGSTAAMASRRTGKQSASSHRQKDSRVVAILKKTGSILTRPFRF